MGMSASATLWYGVKGEIPSDARTELEEPADNEYGEKVINGTHIHIIYSGDLPVGAGGTIAHAWWGEAETVVMENGDGLRGPLLEGRALVRSVNQFLDEYKVPGERGVYLTANFG